MTRTGLFRKNEKNILSSGRSEGRQNIPARRTTRNGFISLGVIILMGIIAASIPVMTRLVREYSKQIDLQTGYHKVRYLARSGMAAAHDHFDQIPELAAEPEKEWLYTNTAALFPVPVPVDGSIYLVRTPATLYSVALYDNFRMIFHASYEKTPHTLTIHTIKKL